VGLNSRYTYFLLAKDFSETCLVAKKEGKIVAFSSGYVPPKRKDTFFNWEIVVDQKHRGQNLQQALLLQQIKLSGAKFLELTINPSNEACKRNVLDLANMLGASCEESVLFSEEDFGNDGHETEILFRVGPISVSAISQI
jgi:L-2,4-diaminobutyric acid acetyltransferase